MDIRKAFDALNRDVFLKVLERFGFSSKFCRQIADNLHSAKVSIIVHGSLVGYFSCTRGVRQCDPLSPLLFRLVEDFLSHLFAKLVESGDIIPMLATRYVNAHSHFFNVDDLLMFVIIRSLTFIKLWRLLLFMLLSQGNMLIGISPSCILVFLVLAARRLRLAKERECRLGLCPFIT